MAMWKITEKLVFSMKEDGFHKYKLKNADWRDEDGLVVLLKQGRHHYIAMNGELRFSIPAKLNHPMVRWISDDIILVANPRCNGEDNMFILDFTGRLLCSFHAGDGIEDIEVGKEGIWVSYCDEGVFGNGISTEGLVLFDFGGNAVFKYHSGLENAPVISDCYAMCKGEGTSIWLLSYTDFPLIHVSFGTGTNVSCETFRGMDGSHAICVRDEDVFFSGGYGKHDQLFRWRRGTNVHQLLGKNDGYIRGLGYGEEHHFIILSEDAVTLLKAEPE